MSSARKVTVELPDDLLSRALKATGEGLEATIRKGLELMVANQAYEDLLALKGKIELSVDWRELREDRWPLIIEDRSGLRVARLDRQSPKVTTELVDRLREGLP